VLGGLAGGEQLLLQADPLLGGFRVGRHGVRRGRRLAFGRLGDVGRGVVARAACVALGHRQRAWVGHVRFRRLVGLVVRRRFGRRLGDEAGRPGAFVAQDSAPLGDAQPAAQQPVGGVEDVLGGKADLRGIALDRLDCCVLAVGIAALVLQRAQDLRQLGEGEGILDIHGWFPFSSGVATIAALLPPETPSAYRSGGASCCNCDAHIKA
jgi:hypothetical protein